MSDGRYRVILILSRQGMLVQGVPNAGAERT